MVIILNLDADPNCRSGFLTLGEDDRLKRQ